MTARAADHDGDDVCVGGGDRGIVRRLDVLVWVGCVCVCII